MKTPADFEPLMTVASESLDDWEEGTNTGPDFGLGMINESVSAVALTAGSINRVGDLVPLKIVASVPVCEPQLNAFAR